MHDNRFVIGSGRPPAPERLARLEAEVREHQAELDRARTSAGVAPPPDFDPLLRMLPERLEQIEAGVAADETKLEEARAAAAVIEVEINEAALSSPERLEGLREALAETQRRIDKAERRVAAGRKFVDKRRQHLPEDAQTEALVRVAWAEVQLGMTQRMLDGARADLMPEDCRDALELLAFHAADEWLERHGPADASRRLRFRYEVAWNIRAGLASAMFGPDLSGLDRLRHITGKYEGRAMSAGGGGGS